MVGQNAAKYHYWVRNEIIDSIGKCIEANNLRKNGRNLFGVDRLSPHKRKVANSQQISSKVFELYSNATLVQKNSKAFITPKAPQPDLTRHLRQVE